MTTLLMRPPTQLVQSLRTAIVARPVASPSSCRLITTLPPKSSSPSLVARQTSLSFARSSLASNASALASRQTVHSFARFGSPSSTLFSRLGPRPFARLASTTTASNGNTAAPVDWTKIATHIGLATVAAVALNYALNRETRGALSPAESSYLHETFLWTGAGIAITATVAKLLHSNGVASRLMALNPWVFMGCSLVASIGSMMAVFATAPDSPAHIAAWAVFSATQGLTLSPLFFVSPAIISRAALYTVGALGGLTYVGATAQSEQFLWIGGVLMAGLGVVIVTSLAPMILPRMAGRTMSTLEHISAYGGVAVFSGFILYDTQKVLNHARMAERGEMVRDAVRESVSLMLDTINLFIKIVQVLLLQQRKK